MSSYKGRRRGPLKKWQRVAAVGSALLLALVGAAVSRAFDGLWDWSTASPPAPAVHLIDQGAAPEGVLADVFAGVVIPQSQVQGDPPSQEDEEITAWAAKYGGVPASGTGHSLQISAPDQALIITSIEPRVLKRTPAVVGAFVGPAGAGTFLQQGLLADLDTQPVTTEVYSDNEEWSFPVSIGNDDNMVVTVLGSTGTGTVEWVVDIHYLVEGRADILTFPDESQPFLATSLGSATKWWKWGSGWSEGSPLWAQGEVTFDPQASASGSKTVNDSPPGVPPEFPGLPLLGGYACGALPSVETGLPGLTVNITSGRMTCPEALTVAKTYIRTSTEQGVRGVGFGDWECGVNSGSGRDAASSNVFCHRDEESVTIG